MIKELNTIDFKKIIKLQEVQLIVVDFWAPWCGPCKTLNSILVELANNIDSQIKIYKVNIDENPSLASDFKIKSIPTIAFFKNSEMIDQIVGLPTLEELKNRIKTIKN